MGAKMQNESVRSDSQCSNFLPQSTESLKCQTRNESPDTKEDKSPESEKLLQRLQTNQIDETKSVKSNDVGGKDKSLKELTNNDKIDLQPKDTDGKKAGADRPKDTMVNKSKVEPVKA